MWYSVLYVRTYRADISISNSNSECVHVYNTVVCVLAVDSQIGKAERGPFEPVSLNPCHSPLRYTVYVLALPTVQYTPILHAFQIPNAEIWPHQNTFRIANEKAFLGSYFVTYSSLWYSQSSLLLAALCAGTRTVHVGYVYAVKRGFFQL